MKKVNRFRWLKRNKLLMSVLVIYGLFFVIRTDIAKLAMSNSIYYLKEMLFVLPIIFLLTIAIDVLVSKEAIIKHLGIDSGIKGSIYALILGSISAGPIYAAFPICKMLIKKGASISNVVIILSAWAVVKLPMLANEVKFLGVSFMMTRWILTVIAIVIIGMITEKSVSTNKLNAIYEED
ncbi:MAG TPA: permease [Clostridiales bacterium UBA8960]|jgi:uncharacterized membrane protein YraQ (UPF0718 family)|nr:permease [Clostridiales bacterium UBA8960]